MRILYFELKRDKDDVGGDVQIWFQKIRLVHNLWSLRSNDKTEAGR